MSSGNHRHLKRLNAPKGWGLDKSSGKYAIRPMPGAHAESLSIPVQYLIKNHLDIALNAKEVRYILRNKLVLVNNKPIDVAKRCVGLLDVLTLKCKDGSQLHYRLIFNTKGTFELLKITPEEASKRFVKVTGKSIVDRTPIIRGSDGNNFTFVDPAIEVNDTAIVDVKTNKIVDHVKFAVGTSVFIHTGSNRGRVGTVQEIVYLISKKCLLTLVDANMKVFTTPLTSAIVVGEGDNVRFSLNSDKGIKLSEFEKSNLKYLEAVEENN